MGNSAFLDSLMQKALLVFVGIASTTLAVPVSIRQQKHQHSLLSQTNGLQLNIYNNSAFAGKPFQSTTVDSLDFQFEPNSFDFSAEVLGELTTDPNIMYTFSCDFGWTSSTASFRQLIAFVWLDDHLVCQTGAYSISSAANTDFILQPLSRTILPVRIHFFAFNIQSSNPPSCSSPPSAATTSTFEEEETKQKTEAATDGTVSFRMFWSPNNLSLANVYEQLSNANVDGGNGRNMDVVGGGVPGTLDQCIALCDSLASKGCIGFVRPHNTPSTSSVFCSLRQSSLSNELCTLNVQHDNSYDTYLRINSCLPPAPIESSRLTPTVSDLEQTRRSLQQSLTVGWGPWTQQNILDIVQLPSGSRFNIGLCQSNGNCFSAVRSDDSSGSRVGLHAYDRSYVQMYISANGGNVSVEYSNVDGNLIMQISPSPGFTDSDFSIRLTPSFAYGRGGVSNVANTTLTFIPSNLPALTLTCASTTSSPHKMLGSCSLEHLFSNGVLVCSTESSVSVADITSRIAKAQATERATYTPYGDLSVVKEAVQAGVMWNWVYVPCEYGPFAPVGRGWTFTGTFLTPDFAYVLFDWDNIFSSYMLSLDAKNHSYSNLIQIIRAKTGNGFVPNYAAGGIKSQDRTEPPIGAKVLYEIYNKYKDTWIVEYLFDDLLDWVTWFHDSRRLAPLNITALGSSYVPRADAANMQGARYESGLDNSPMYDGEFFNTTSGLMELYDVGMAAMAVNELQHLAKLARVIGRPEAAKLNAWASELGVAITQNLWDTEGQVFTNKFSTTGDFYSRISPTSFYPMMAGLATDTQAAQMMTGWLLNSTRFCISPTGDYSGNNDSCYWGLPSINAQDPAYPPLGYWRGYVWGPMAQLTYWSLEQYGHVTEVATARLALAKQMKGMFLNMWYQHHHVCENYSPHRTDSDCTGNLFYTWGGLTGFLSLLEEGYY